MYYTDEERSFLADHRWAVLATGREDGSPAQTMVGYTLDGEGRILISIPRSTAKWKNASRRPGVAFAVAEGRVNVIVYGVAESIVDDPERAELSADILAVVGGPDRPDPAAFVGWLDEQGRGVLRITPQKVLMHY